MALIASLVAAISVAIAPRAGAATVVYESESNGTKTSANTLPFGTTMRGSAYQATSYADTDYFLVDVPSTGQLVLSLTFPDGLGTGQGYEVEVYNEEGDPLFDSVVPASEGKGVGLKSESMFVGPGAYYVKVYGYSANATWGKNYDLTVTQVPRFSETEFNGATDAAIPLPLAKAIYGSANAFYFGDDDYYAVDIPSTGQLVLNLQFPSGLGAGDAYSVHVYDAGGAELYSFDVPASKNDGSWLKSRAMYVSPGKYFVRVYGSEYDATWKKAYSLSVWHRAAHAETEFNNTNASADVLGLGVPIEGSTGRGSASPADRDCYILDVPQAGEVDIALTFPGGLGTGGGYTVDLVNNASVRVYQYKVAANEGSGVALRDKSTRLSKGKHYLCVDGRRSDATWHQPYKLTVGSPFVSVGAPAVTGTAAVGSQLTAKPGTSSPAATSHTYQWMRNGTAIAGATASTYTLAAADVDRKVSVQVTPVRAGYAALPKTSSAVSVVRAFTAAPTPTVTGTAKVGNKVTASVGAWSPTPTSFSYQWFRDGVKLSGATASQYTLTTADAGRQVSVMATATRAGYATLGKASARVSVPWMTFASAPTPTVTGTVAVGNKLTASVGTWSPTPDSITYQWFRDGVKLSGATASQYTLTTADAGRQVSVMATAKKAGYTSVGKASARVSVPWMTFTSAPTPTIDGTLAAGNAVTASVGAWSPSPDSLTYQWFRDGVAITGATASQFTLTAEDAGHQVSVIVTAKKAGHKSVSKASSRVTIAS